MTDQIEGFGRVVERLGFETKFHDSEIVNIQLDRNGQSPSLTVAILTRASLWPEEWTGWTSPYFIVRLEFEELADLKLENFNHQNVLQEMTCTNENDRLRFVFAGTFGVDGSFSCRRARVFSVEETSMKYGASSR